MNMRAQKQLPDLLLTMFLSLFFGSVDQSHTSQRNESTTTCVCVYVFFSI